MSVLKIKDSNNNWVNVPSIKGDKGDIGNAATITIGTVTTLDAHASATVTNGGTTGSAILNFGIPKGVSVGSVSKTTTSGNIDTYTIYSDDSTPSALGNFEVTNSSVYSVAGKTGAVTLDAGDVAYDPTETYTSGTVGKAVRDQKEQIDGKANVDGYYDELSVGNAEQLIATVGVEDKVPYNFRTSGGSADIGDREVDEVVGGTVAWNQLVLAANFAATGGTVSTDANYVATFTASGSGQQAYRTASLIGGHKVLGAITFKTTTASADIKMRAFATDYNGSATIGWQTVWVIKNVSTTGTQSVGVIDRRESDWDAILIKNAMFIDLTRMFGSAIADYIYSLETATPGAGVAWFRKLFPKDYYAYDAGSLQSVQASAHKMVGFNAWDEEWEVGDIIDGQPHSNSGCIRSKNFSPCIPGATYYLQCGSATNEYFVRAVCYDSQKNYIGPLPWSANRTFTVPDNCYFFKITTQSASGAAYGNVYNHDICINLSWDGSRNGEYEPYEAHAYALDSDLELRGIPKLDADNKLYYNGDEYASDGTVTRNYRELNLGGTSTVNYGAWGSTNVFTYNLANTAKSFANDVIGNIICAKYDAVTPNAMYNSPKNKTVCMNGTTLRIVDSDYTDAATFKTAMSGVYLVYELATPTTESADPYINPQIVNDFGTEEYVDSRTVPIPVGHVTQYQANLRAKLEMAPNSPGGDGDYIVRQSSGQNAYVPLVLPLDELPAAPSTDGTYVLKVTVASGEATYSWVSE